MTQPRINPICSVCQNPYETYQKRDGRPHREFCSMACANRAKVQKASQTLWDRRRAAGDMRSPRVINKISAEEHARLKAEPKSPCACGCGNPVNRVGRRYIHGHYANVTRTTRITKRCLWCQKEFAVAEKYKDRHHYCSKSCQMKYQLTGERKTEWVKRICPICQSEYETSARDLEVGRRVTCSYACGIEATRRSKIKGEDGNCTTPWVQRAQTIAIRQSCDHCEYFADPDILVIHHKDHNPKNGDPANILLLCPNCHALEHKKLKSGWFKETKVKNTKAYRDGHKPSISPT